MWPDFSFQMDGIILDPHLIAIWGPAGMCVLAGFIFIVGCCLGSFANACAMRLVRDEDFILSASRCRGCDKRLRWHDNLPVVWLSEASRPLPVWQDPDRPALCHRRNPGRPASARHAVMLPPAMASDFPSALSSSPSPASPTWRSLTLHPALLTVFGLTGLLLSLLADFPFWPGILAARSRLPASYSLPPCRCLINAIYRAVRGQNGFGEGDFWLLGAMGAWLGPVAGIGVFLVASWLGAAYGIVHAGAWPRIDHDAAAVRPVCRNCVYPLVEFIYAGILAPANIKSGSVTRPEMSASSFKSFRSLTIAGAVSVRQPASLWMRRAGTSSLRPFDGRKQGCFEGKDHRPDQGRERRRGS